MHFLGEISPRAQRHRAVLRVRQAPPAPVLRVLSFAHARDSARRLEWRAARIHPRVEQGDMAVPRGLRRGAGGLPSGPRPQGVIDPQFAHGHKGLCGSGKSGWKDGGGEEESRAEGASRRAEATNEVD